MTIRLLGFIPLAGLIVWMSISLHIIANRPPVDLVGLVERYETRIATLSAELKKEKEYSAYLMESWNDEKIASDYCIGFLNDEDKEGLWELWEELDKTNYTQKSP